MKLLFATTALLAAHQAQAESPLCDFPACKLESYGKTKFLLSLTLPPIPESCIEQEFLSTNAICRVEFQAVECPESADFCDPPAAKCWCEMPEEPVSYLQTIRKEGQIEFEMEDGDSDCYAFADLPEVETDCDVAIMMYDCAYGSECVSPPPTCYCVLILIEPERSILETILDEGGMQFDMQIGHSDCYNYAALDKEHIECEVMPTFAPPARCNCYLIPPPMVTNLYLQMIVETGRMDFDMEVGDSDCYAFADLKNSDPKVDCEVLQIMYRCAPDTRCVPPKPSCQCTLAPPPDNLYWQIIQEDKEVVFDMNVGDDDCLAFADFDSSLVGCEMSQATYKCAPGYDCPDIPANCRCYLIEPRVIIDDFGPYYYEPEVEPEVEPIVDKNDKFCQRQLQKQPCGFIKKCHMKPNKKIVDTCAGSCLKVTDPQVYTINYAQQCATMFKFDVNIKGEMTLCMAKAKNNCKTFPNLG